MNDDQPPPQILEVYGSRLCFYCDSQTDPNMQDQVAEVTEPLGSKRVLRVVHHHRKKLPLCDVLGRPWRSGGISIRAWVFAFLVWLECYPSEAPKLEVVRLLVFRLFAHLGISLEEFG